MCVSLCFPVALLLFATWFFGGDLGWWSDDYWHNQRDPVTGEVAGLTIRRGFFLRPLFYVIVPALTTLAWHHDWIAHGVQAAAHAGVVLLLWRFMLTLGLSGRASAAAAMLFMVFPPQFEAVFWVAALPTVLAAGVMLGIFFLTVAWARGCGWWTVAVMPALAFALCCLNEQPAAGIVALPLVYLAAGGRVGWRMLLPAAACGAAAVAYIALVRLEAPPGSRGSAENLVTWAGLPERVDYFTTVLWRRLYMRNFARGALGLGWEQVRAAGWIGWVWGVVLVGTGAVWVKGWVRGGVRFHQCGVSRREPGTRRLGREDPRNEALTAGEDAGTSPGGRGGTARAARLLLGPVVFLTGCLPILVLANYDPDSRTRYWPCVGLAVLIAAMGTALGRAWPRGRAAGAATRAGLWVAGVSLLGVLLTFATVMVGVQAAFRSRQAMDRDQGAQLRRLVPDPVPYTFFVPMNIENVAADTGSPVFDRHLRSVWEFPWTTPSYIQRVYGREDVRCGYWRHWTPGEPVVGADARGIHYKDTLGPRFPEIAPGVRLIPWERAVVFTVDRAGTVRLVTRVVPANGPAFDVPQAEGLPELELRLR